MTDYTTLIDADELHTLSPATDLVIIDCRFSLADPSAGHGQYLDSHLPGAVYAHLDNDLSSPIVQGISGRHPLPEAAAFIDRLQSWGVNTQTQIVTYDNGPGAMAARAWWLCQWIGHASCAVLNGGMAAWVNAGYSLTNDVPTPDAGNISHTASLVNQVSVNDVLSEDRLLVDARDSERFSGEHEPLDKVGGHIPGALNLPFSGNLGTDGKFLPSSELHNRFQPLVKCAVEERHKTITHYCGSGVTAAHNILAMAHAGYDPTDLYAGSWSEWIQDSDRETAIGKD